MVIHSTVVCVFKVNFMVGVPATTVGFLARHAVRRLLEDYGQYWDDYGCRDNSQQGQQHHRSIYINICCHQ